MRSLSSADMFVGFLYKAQNPVYTLGNQRTSALRAQAVVRLLSIGGSAGSLTDFAQQQ
eukprot:COSAG06_NODE_12785_length_1330_cov_1.350122_1_plen_57_part_10